MFIGSLQPSRYSLHTWLYNRFSKSADQPYNLTFYGFLFSKSIRLLGIFLVCLSLSVPLFTPGYSLTSEKLGNNLVYCFLVDFLEVFLISGINILNIVDFFGIYVWLFSIISISKKLDRFWEVKKYWNTKKLPPPATTNHFFKIRLLYCIPNHKSKLLCLQEIT